MVIRFKNALPYLVLLAGAVGFYVLTLRIEYTSRPGQLGPDTWPKLAIGLIAIVCLFELLRALATENRAEAVGITEQLEQGETAEDDAPRRPLLLAAGIGMTIAYGALVSQIGFPLATFLYLAAFMYVGGFRSHGAIWLSSIIGSASLTVLFLKVVYVSLPRGAAPFDRITDLLTGSL
ncbi:tripartite tricarboxylate transporter TctB family protein [Pseudorhodoplanes sinuspersici]|uniref:Uncharacterized protein n=1 Tax=Pseudorhodoplanes sinuspersici TaxID=1235591 RepID=A0A1W6ZPH1_9HYPH|nr:tripartite tricarboxylate transporter TctB family protein [Pseudorhodoplanes sinuspersici]ARP99271.1 hypothetical protein CAK95_09400 [Pseudorhodoplanes sinuspersici]RKE69047.1 tripartite tricarboxylate transporter TctB family protein [Pseudorhodoplanes sinuspersici]